MSKRRIHSSQVRSQEINLGKKLGTELKSLCSEEQSLYQTNKRGSTKNLKLFKTSNWTKKLSCWLGLTGISTLIALPVLAQFYPPYTLFQPLAYPGSPYRSCKSNIIDTLSKCTDSQFDNLVAELKDAGLSKTVAQEKFTVLAPTDAAFNALPDEIFDKFSQPENRLKVLKYHLVSGEITKEDVDKGEVKTLEGNAIAISNEDGKIKLNDANAKHPSTVTNNGVIIEIDQVLLPPGF
jgi:hypothetical protein